MQQCFPAYTRGPCAPGQYLILPANHVVPACQRNPCVDDNFVLFRDACYELDKEGPCTWGKQISNVVGVNETTLEIMCTKDYKIEIWTRLSDDDANKTMDNGGNGYTPTPPPIIPDDPSPIINGTKYIERKCFIGGKRWIVAKQTVFKDFNSYYEYCNAVNRSPSADPQFQLTQNIQDIFSTNPGLA